MVDGGWLLGIWWCNVADFMEWGELGKLETFGFRILVGLCGFSALFAVARSLRFHARLFLNFLLDRCVILP